MLLSSALLFGYSAAAGSARAEPRGTPSRGTLKPTASLRAHQLPHARVSVGTTATSGAARIAMRRGPTRSYGISCVPYARDVSGIRVVGNAWQWWNKAAGEYARGDQPEPGSVLDFRSNKRMPLGHVAVVARVVNPREVIVDHANWPDGHGSGKVSHDIAVVDVSEANNWSAVRVELGHGDKFGSVYPTYGFIYNRPDTGVILANASRPAPQPEINPVPSDLRPVAERSWHPIEEVAEAPTAPPHRSDLPATPVKAGLSR